MDIRTLEAMKIPTMPTELPIPLTSAYNPPSIPDMGIVPTMYTPPALTTYELPDMGAAPVYTPSADLSPVVAPASAAPPDYSDIGPVASMTAPPPDYSGLVPAAPASTAPPDYSGLVTPMTTPTAADLSYLSIMPMEYIPPPDTSAWVPDFTELKKIAMKRQAEAAERHERIIAFIAAMRKRMADAMAEHKRRMEAIEQINADARARMDKAIADMRARRIALNITNKATIEKMKAGQATPVNIQLHNLSAEAINAKIKMSALNNLTDLFTVHMNPGETVTVPHTVNLADRMRFSVSEIIGE